MKFLAMTTLSLAAIAALANLDPPAVGADPSTGAGATTTTSPLMLAQRRGKCSENLGYGRSGTYGCG